MINQSIINHFPCWIYDLHNNPDNYWLILSDDMDSLLTCSFLLKTLNAHVGGFYDFAKGLFLNEAAHTQSRNHVYVDVACAQDGYLCFDNHRTVARNHMAVNPNIYLSHDTRLYDTGYHRKYCGSTLLLVAALYGINPCNEQKMKLLATDGFYKGFYTGFRKINTQWLRQLGLYDVLIPTLKQHTAVEFVKYINDNRLNDKLYLDTEHQLRRYSPGHTYKKPRAYEGSLVTMGNEDLVFPYQQFSVRREFRTTNEMKSWNQITGEPIFTAAEFQSGTYAISIRDKPEQETNKQCA